MAEGIEIRLLGELQVLRGGEPLALPQSRKTRALLAYLVCRPGPKRREQLCELLWQLPDDPRGSLRWSLSKLRGLVNGERLERIRADREHVEFLPEDLCIDLFHIRERLGQPPDTLETRELAEHARSVSAGCLEGLELSGQPEFDAFLVAQREEVRQLRCSILRSLLERRQEAAAPDVIGWLRQLVKLEPFEAALHQSLIEALAMAGRADEARRQREASVEALTGIAGVDLRALHLAEQRRPDGLAGESAEPAAEAGTQADSLSVPGEQDIRFCRTADGVSIAYATVGEGAPLVKTANWLNHLEYDWESPVWRHVFAGLCEGRQLIRYDARGNGLSDWNIDEYHFEHVVGDLEAVVDAVGLERFPLLGISQGCAVSVEYAARHPERVSRLVLVGGYARGWRQWGIAELESQTEAMITLVRMGWGKQNPAFRQMFTSMFMPDAPAENQQWFNELQRKTTTPRNAARLLHASGDVDVRARLPEVRAPTLVLHARDDCRIPFEAGRELASGIPGARFVGLDSRNHLMPDSDAAWPRMLAEIKAFLAEGE